MAYAKSVDPDQTSSSGPVWPGFAQFAIPPNILRNNCIKTQFEPKTMEWNKVFEILGHLT